MLQRGVTQIAMVMCRKCQVDSAHMQTCEKHHEAVPDENKGSTRCGEFRQESSYQRPYKTIQCVIPTRIELEHLLILHSPSRVTPDTRKIQQRCFRLEDLAPPAEVVAGVEGPMAETWILDIRLAEGLLGVRAKAMREYTTRSASSSSCCFYHAIAPISDRSG